MKRTILLTTLSALALTIAVTGFAGPVAAANDGKADRMIGFAQLDTNGDGAVSAEEFQASRQARFKAIDTNGDGALSADEMNAARAKVMQDRGKGKPKDRAARMIEYLDQNGDGLLSAEELAARRDPDRMFDRVDTNNDGSVSKEEFAAAREKFAEHRRQGGKHGGMHWHE